MTVRMPGIGLAGSFAAMWCMEHEGEQIGLIPCAEGGSSLDDWAVDKNLFKNAVIQAGFAMQDSELIGILWHQAKVTVTEVVIRRIIKNYR